MSGAFTAGIASGAYPTDRGRNATKVSATVASDGVPVALAFFPGNTSDQRTVEVTLCARLAPRAAPWVPMYADKGYDRAAGSGALCNVHAGITGTCRVEFGSTWP